MADLTRISRPSFYDFMKASTNDMSAEQESNQGLSASNFDAVAGSGVLLEFPEEPIIFDSNNLDAFQQGLVAINTLDGQGIMENPYITSDPASGTQLSLTISDARLDGFLSTKVFVLGKLFDSTLAYEIIDLSNNLTALTKNHFTEVTNILLQNFRGNLNSLVDGYGSFNVGGTLVISEASSMKPTRDPIVSEQVDEPNVCWRFFKTADPGKSLQTTVTEAIGSSNDIDDLNINTTAAQTRTFVAGGGTDIIYGQKFQMKGDNVQKISLLLSLESGSTWSGTLVVGIRPLQTTVTCTTDFLPDDNIAFDPSTESIEELAIDQADLLKQGIELDQEVQVVDFVFSGANIANPNLSNLVEGDFYVVTVRRSGSPATGTIELQEARNSDTTKRLTVFDNAVWTDVTASSLWYQVWGDAARVVSGAAYDDGVRLVTPKTIVDNNAATVQNFVEDLDFANTSEDAENYLILQKSVLFTDVESHPRTGNDVFSKKEDVPSFSMLEQSEVFSLLTADDETVLLARMRDRNAKNNPTITGTTALPGLVLGNTITVINPGTDLLTQNVVGSVITPNTNKPNLRYRIAGQNFFTDLYGDMDGDGAISVSDAARIAALDGYAIDLSSGTVAAATQLAAVQGGATSVSELLQGDVNASIVLDSTDVAIVNLFINDGYALPAGSSFTRLELTVEPLTDPITALNANATSSLLLEVADPDFIDNVTFTTLPFSIEFCPNWHAENLEVLDLRRYVTTSFLDFDSGDLTSVPENGGKNNLFVPGGLFLTDTINNLDGTAHKLDYEKAVVSIELPTGDTNGEFNIYESYVQGIMKFSDGTFVPNNGLINNQVRFDVSISSYSKNLDGYDMDGYGTNSEEVVGTYLDHSTGLLRIDAFNIVYNEIFPQIRTRIEVSIELKKSGFTNANVFVAPDELAQVLV